MVSLFLLSLISVFFFDRYIYLKSQKRVEPAFFEKIKELVSGCKIETALALCASTDSSESRILVKGIQNLGKPLRDIREEIELEAKKK